MQELKSLTDAVDLVQVFRRYFRFDKNFMRTKNLAGMLKTAIDLASKHAPINQISLPGITESDDPTVDTRLFVSDENLKAAYDAFMTGKRATNPTRSDLPTKTAKKSKKGKVRRSVSGLVDARRLGEDMAVLNAKQAQDAVLLPGADHRPLAVRERHAAGLQDPGREGQEPQRLPARRLPSGSRASTGASRA